MRVNSSVFGFAGGGGGGGGNVNARLTFLENVENKILYFISVSSDSGTLALPSGATILLDQLYKGEDAYVTTIENGQPTGILPQTSGGVPVVVTSFNTSGDYVLSGVPSAYPVAIMFLLSIAEINKPNLNQANIIEEAPIEQNRIITTISSSATPTLVISDDNKITDVLVITALATGATFAISGTPTNDKAIIFYIRDNGTARALTFGSGTFTVIGTPNPTTTVINKWLAVGARWNATMSRWFILAVNQEA